MHIKRWEACQQKCLKVKPSVSRPPPESFDQSQPGGEGNQGEQHGLAGDLNWEVWGRKAGCWRKPTRPPWQSWKHVRSGLARLQPVKCSIGTMPPAPSLGLAFLTSQSPVTLLCLFSGYLMGKKAPELLVKWRESPVGWGSGTTLLQGRILERDPAGGPHLALWLGPDSKHCGQWWPVAWALWPGTLGHVSLF